MNIKPLKEHIAPMTKEQYEAKMKYAYDQANNIMMHIVCYGQTLHINGEQYSWNGSHQRILLQTERGCNEISCADAFYAFRFYALEEKEYRFR